MIKNITKHCQLNNFSEKYEKLLTSYLEKVNINEIESRLSIRKDRSSLAPLRELLTEFKSGNINVTQNLMKLINDLPNSVSQTTPAGKELDSKVIKQINKNVNNHARKFEEVGNLLSLFKKGSSSSTEDRAYYLNGNFATLERALMRYTISFLIQNGFNLIFVPDIINNDILRRCGFKLDPMKNQIYNVITNPEQIHDLFFSNELNNENLAMKCLAGTSELPLAAYASNTVFDNSQLPIKLCAMSRCYRREVSVLEKGLYRVHQFNKVEMFCITNPNQSDQMFDSLVDIQEKLISSLGFGYRILNMASEELGEPAHKKVDIESFMEGENRFGEISSASNCTDYQARQFDILYQTENQDLDFVHTLNGTGCAIPRLLKTIVEAHLDENGHVLVPPILRKYMQNVDKITRQHPPHKISQVLKIVENL